MRRFAFLLIMIVAASALLFDLAQAQRRVTPVESPDELKMVNKEELKKIKQQAVAKFMRTDSLTLDSLRRDSIEKVTKKVKRPTLMDISAGVDIWEPLMRAFGQDYGGGGLWVSLNIKNRFIPIAEFGLGYANATPDDGNFTYKTNLAFYGRIGMNYNFLASKDPRYQLFAGLRFAGSSFSYDITNVRVGNGYWGESSSRFDILDQKSSAVWGEFVLGIKVELFRNFCMGWTVRYNFPFSIKDTPNSRPWYIPGYGTRNNHLNVSLSLAYTIPLHKERKEKAETPVITPEDMIQPVDTVTVPERHDRVTTPRRNLTPQDSISIR